MDDGQVHLGARQPFPGRASGRRRVDHADVDHFGHGRQTGGDGTRMSLQPLPQTGKLGPVGLQADGREPHHRPGGRGQAPDAGQRFVHGRGRAVARLRWTLLQGGRPSG